MFMNNKDIYNNAYKKFTPEFVSSQNLVKLDEYMQNNSASLVDFLSKFREQFSLERQMKSSQCLELGCGIGSLSFELEKYFQEVKAIDISNLAIANAKSIQGFKKSHVEFLCMDAMSLQEKIKYDFIIDSHLLHCLVNDADRQMYFRSVKNLLKKGGKFLIETMIFNPEIEIPLNYFYDENRVLWKDNIAFRKLNESSQIENELLEAGLKIEYFYYHSELSFLVFEDYPHISHDKLPKTLRICTTLV